MTITGQPVGHRYRLFGLTLASEIPLPELHPGSGTPDVIIERGPVPPPVGESVKGLTRVEGGAVFDVPGVGRYRIGSGTRIEVDALPGAPERDVRAYLIGSAMGVLLHQRGRLALHANAIDIAGRAIAFCGRSGAGKSTLAATFHDRGRPLLSDDLCVVAEESGHFLAQPGIPRMRLWRDAVLRTGRDAETLTPVFEANGKDKFVVPLDESHAGAPLPLGAIYTLTRSDQPITEFEIRPLQGVAAAQAIARFTYRRAFVPIAGDPREHFATCLRLSQSVPVHAIFRPWDSSRVDEMAELVEAHFAAL